MVLRVHTIYYAGASAFALLEVAGFAGVAFVFLGGALRCGGCILLY
jgi:hypothetical protein